MQVLQSHYLIIYHIVLHKVYYETRALFSGTNLRIYDKWKREQVKVILFYKSLMESNTLLFDPTDHKIGHSRVGQAQVAFTDYMV